MKVKNIMFAGFAAAILSGACGAARAEAEAGSTAKILASKAFVEAQVADKVSTETYNAHLNAQQAIDAKQTQDIASNLSKINALDEASGGNITGIVTRLDTLEGDAQKEGSVAQKIATAVAAEEQRADAAYAVKELETTVSNLATNVADNYVSKTALEQEGYQTQTDVQAEIAAADIAMGKVTGLSAALDEKQDTLTFDDTPTVDSTNPVKSGGVYSALAGKAATGDVSALGTRVETLENAGYQNAGQVQSAIDTATSDMLTQTLASTTYATAEALAGVKATAEAAQTAEEVQSAIDTATSDMLTQTLASTTYATAEALAGVKATAEAAQTETQVAAAINTKVETLDKEDAAVANQFVTAVSEADGVIAVSRAALTAENIPELPQAKVTNLEKDLAGKLDKATENGSYLVTKDASGIRYTAVQVVAGDGTTDLLTGAALVQ